MTLTPSHIAVCCMLSTGSLLARQVARQGGIRQARGSKRLRSRNHVIDEWLGDEKGEDMYADLEDFLVDG